LLLAWRATAVRTGRTTITAVRRWGGWRGVLALGPPHPQGVAAEIAAIELLDHGCQWLGFSFIDMAKPEAAGQARLRGSERF